MNKPRIVFALVISSSIAGVAWARATFHDIPVAEAKQSSQSGQLRDVPFYMADETHPKVAKDLGEFTSNRRTNAFNKTDVEACHIAFLSAVIALQERAMTLGGDGVIDIRSTTRHNELSSATEYRCAAGNVVANVVLVGRVVKFATPGKTQTPAKRKPGTK